MKSSGGALLSVSGLTKRFGGLVAVKNMALQVGAGEILGLIGPNGSGKSTVMKLIMGIERPDKGSVRINGTEVAGWPSHKIARMGAGIVFQHCRPLHRQTVLENISWRCYRTNSPDCSLIRRLTSVLAPSPLAST